MTKHLINKTINTKTLSLIYLHTINAGKRQNRRQHPDQKIVECLKVLEWEKSSPTLGSPKNNRQLLLLLNSGQSCSKNAHNIIIYTIIGLIIMCYSLQCHSFNNINCLNEKIKFQIHLNQFYRMTLGVFLYEQRVRIQNKSK